MKHDLIAIKAAELLETAVLHIKLAGANIGVINRILVQDDKFITVEDLMGLSLRTGFTREDAQNYLNEIVERIDQP